MKCIAIVGMKYIDKKFNLNPNLFVNGKIILQEEENNKYDKKAIAAYYFDKDDNLVKFGYVAKNNNDGTIDLTNVYKIVRQTYTCITVIESKKEESEDEEYYKRMEEEIDNPYIGACYHDKPKLNSEIFNVYNTREEDEIFDFMDNEEENDFWDTLFNDFFW
jgi:hypothetical protein